jgi:hypothetical protein
MDATMIDEHLENLDRRLANVEQILPTLATRAELHAAIAPLATKDDLAELRRHMTILIEHQDSKLELLAEHLLKGKPSKE